MTRPRNRQGLAPIRPELIDTGDIIQVQYPDADGITVTHTGVVAYVQAHAGMRHFLTQQGGVIARYSPGIPEHNRGMKFFLVARMSEAQPMFDIFEESGRL